MTKELRRLSIIMLAMFLSLFIATSWIQVVEADALAQNTNNKRTLLDSYEIQRGSIIASGTPIAYSIPTDDTYAFQRVYTDAAMWAPVTGYFNPALQSSTGLERAMNAQLSGTGAGAFLAEIDRIVSGQPQTGSSIALSLDAEVQRTAYEALDGLEGAVVAIEPSTGRILALASSPSYDTNQLASHDVAAVSTTYDQLEAAADNPLYNRAIAGSLNPPGSTFKLVTASAAYSTGEWTPESTLPNPARYTLPGTNQQIANSGGGTCGPGETVSIADAIRLSCNIPMAQLAVAVGEDAMRETAEAFGFDLSFETPTPSTASTYPRGLSDDQVALTGFGQGDVRATPLQIAMVSAGIANDGVVMNPRMVDAVIGADLSTQTAFENTEFGRAVEESVAQDVTDAMVASVASGAASNARIDGVDVAGKTGTAENGDTEPYTLWFTGFAPADDPQVAVAVVVEDGGGKGQSGSGNSIAAPIAKKIIEAVLNK
ncbi:MAG TPA: penicillin-binding protein 2 [Microbacterium sp.]|nr:penicillin-binding protein 2 [Microbacterium sp.]